METILFIISGGEHYGEGKHKYYSVFNKDANLKLIPVDTYEIYNDEINELESYYNLISSDNLNGNFILTDELIEGYLDLKINHFGPSIFVNMETYNKISSDCKEYLNKMNGETKDIWHINDNIYVKIKCNNIMEFKNYIEDINKKQNIEIVARYFSLQNQEKIVYINIIQLILKLITLAIVIIGVVSTINIINASLVEREQDFKILNSLGATKGNIKKILIYECIYMYIKAVIISIIISIPIIAVIVKYMENIIILDKLLIPYGSIGIFMVVLFLISLAITLYSTRMIKEEK